MIYSVLRVTGRGMCRWVLVAAGSAFLALSGVDGAVAAEPPEKDVLLGQLPGLTIPVGVVFDEAGGAVLAAGYQAADGRAGEVRVFPDGGGPAVAVLPECPGEVLEPENNFPVGLAVDSSGDVYVSNPEHLVVDKFAPNGPRASEGFSCVSQYSGFSARTGPVGLAVDQSGDLYVADPGSNEVDEFNAASVMVAQFAAGDHPKIGEPVGVALDASGDLFIQNSAHELVELVRGPSGEVLAEELIGTESPDVQAISFDSAAGVLLISENGHVRAYDPLTNKLLEPSAFGFETPRQLNSNNSSVAISETSGLLTAEVYVENREENVIEIYGPAPPVPPSVSDEQVADVTSSSARLSATIEPRFRDTRYSFQYGPDQSYADGERPAAPGALAPGVDASVLSNVQLEGLAPGKTYHYRVVASNKEGTTYGPDQTFTTFQTPIQGLPDSRVWEMVSPLDKNGGRISGSGATQASADGGKIAFVSQAAFGAARGNPVGYSQYLASRTPTGWSTQNTTPPLKSGSYFLVIPVQAFSIDLSHTLLRNGGVDEGLPISNPPLPGSGAPAGYENFYVRDNEDDDYQALLTSEPAVALPNTDFGLAVEGITPDLKHIVVSIKNALTGGGNFALAEWSDGALVPVNIGIHGELVGRTIAGSGLSIGPVLGSGRNEGTSEAHAISGDGERVFWSVGGDVQNPNRPGGEGGEPVFVREGVGGPAARTVQLPPGEFVDASAKIGSRVLLSTGEVFDVDDGRSLGYVTSGEGGFVGELGASEGLSRIYFVDTAVLPGAGVNGGGAGPVAGGDNLYLYSEGRPVRFIARLTGGDEPDWAGELPEHIARVSGDGGSVVFESVESLTGYDNRDAVSGAPDSEVFEYRASSGSLVCVSCNPSGQRPVGSASIPAGEGVENETSLTRAYYQPRVMVGGGARVFFESPEALVAQDTNGVGDVYEYEGGHVALISGGTGGSSSFVDASESGDDVFFLTANQLVAGDSDQLTDLYDARVGGGFAVPAAAPVCGGTGCQGVPTGPPLFATPASVTFEGVGNLVPEVSVKKRKTETASQIRAGKLASALRACVKGRRAQRAKCEARARKRYGPAKAKKARTRRTASR